MKTFFNTLRLVFVTLWLMIREKAVEIIGVERRPQDDCALTLIFRSRPTDDDMQAVLAALHAPAVALEPVAFMYWNEPDTQRHLTTLKEAIGSHWTKIVPLYAAVPAVPRLAEALREAITLIRSWHGPVAWHIYNEHSPEMKRLHAALAEYDAGLVVDEGRQQSTTTDDTGET